MKKKLLVVNRDILRLEAELNVHESERQAALAVLHERMRSQDGVESALHSFVSAHHGAHDSRARLRHLVRLAHGVGRVRSAAHGRPCECALHRRVGAEEAEAPLALV